MNSEELTAGGVKAADAERTRLAKLSLAHVLDPVNVNIAWL